MTEYYLITTKNLAAFFNALVNAEAPKKLGQKFIEQLEFKSTNDRLLIGVLKGLKFINDSGAPQERYFKFLDQGESKKILAEAIREGYSELFAINKKANEYSPLEVKNKLKTIYQGTKSDNVLDLMAKTFKALCTYADWSSPTSSGPPERREDHAEGDKSNQKGGGEKDEKDEKDEKGQRIKTPELHYNIQIHLPESRDAAVYDAIFKSLKEHFN